MKVHQLINWLDSGDAVSNDCIALAQYLRDLGYESEIFVGHLQPQFRHLARPAKELQGSSDDLVILHFCGGTDVLPEYIGFPGSRILKYHGITPPPFFLHTAGMKELAQHGYEGLAQLRRLAGITQLGVGDSTFDAGELAEAGYRPTAVLAIAINPSDLINAAFDKNLVQGFVGADYVNLLFVGRLAPNKRADDLLELLKAYKQECTQQVRLFLVGKTTEHYAHYVSDLRKKAAAQGLKEGVDFLFPGKVTQEELHGYYRMASAFVSMSEHEGFGVPLVEAMALGVPTFGFACTAVSETIGSGGELFQKKDFRQLAKQIHAAVSNRRQREELIQRQYKRLQEFEPVATKGRLLELLSVVQKDRRPEAHCVATAATWEVPISVVIRAPSGATGLQRTLKSLAAQSYRSFEVIVVDIHPTDEPEAAFGDLQRIRYVTDNERNAAASRNVGIRAARGDIVAFIDANAVASRDWLAEVAKHFEDWHVGAVGGAVLGGDGQQRQFANGTVSRAGSLVAIRENPVDFNDPNGVEFNIAMGANSAFRRVALYDVGLLDEEFTDGYGIADLCVRLIRSEWKVVHAPSVGVVQEPLSDPMPDLYDPSWCEVVKNAVYFGLKHRAPDAGAIEQLIATVRTIYREKYKTAREWDRGGESGRKLHQKSLRNSIRGAWQGYRKALHYRHPSHENMPSGAIQPYIEDQEMPLSICILAQDLPSKKPGNETQHRWTLALGLSDLGHNVHVVTKGTVEGSDVRDGVAIHTVVPSTEELGLAGQATAEKMLRYSLSVARKVRELHQSQHFDIVDTPLCDVEGLAFALRPLTSMIVRLQTRPTRVMADNQWSSSEDFELCTELERELIQRADGLVAPAKYIFDEIQESHGLSCKAMMAVIPIDVAAARDCLKDTVRFYRNVIAQRQRRQTCRSIQ